MNSKTPKKPKNWSSLVTTDTLALEPGLFTWDNPRKIALSLKRSAIDAKVEHPYKSAMSMLCFYINRAGTNLSRERKRTLNQAKLELKKIFKRD